MLFCNGRAICDHHTHSALWVVTTEEAAVLFDDFDVVTAPRVTHRYHCKYNAKRCNRQDFCSEFWRESVRWGCGR